jgi:hypothetical protein
MDRGIASPHLARDLVHRQAVLLAPDVGENLLASEVFEVVTVDYDSHSSYVRPTDIGVPLQKGL